MSIVGIVDYGAGNLLSVKRAIEKIGHSAKLINSNKDFQVIDQAIIPGVGAFPAAMQKLQNKDLQIGVNKHVQSGKPLLGICLGMQMLFEMGFEGEDTSGLGYLKGNVHRIDKIPGFLHGNKVPHIGWSKIDIKKHTSIFNDFNGSRLYHVHSYTPQECCRDELLGITHYAGAELNVFFEKDNVVGVQFHPEKSGWSGLKMLQCFIEKK